MTIPATDSAEVNVCQCLSSLHTLMMTVTQAHLPQWFKLNHCTANGDGWGSSRCFILLTCIWGRDILDGQVGAVRFYFPSPEESKNHHNLLVKSPDVTLFTAVGSCSLHLCSLLRFTFENSGHNIEHCGFSSALQSRADNTSSPVIRLYTVL